MGRTWAHFTDEKAEVLKEGTCLEGVMGKLRMQPSPDCAPRTCSEKEVGLGGRGAWAWAPVLAIPPGIGTSQGQALPSLGLTFSQVKVKAGLAWQLPAS